MEWAGFWVTQFHRIEGDAMKIGNGVFAAAVAAVSLLSTQAGRAQERPSYERVQPIVLTALPTCCQSPADTASQPVCLPAGDRTYLQAAERDPLVATSNISQLAPLPTPQQWRGYAPEGETVVEYPAPVPNCAASTEVRVLRPTVVLPPAPTVPEGYVVGRGLIGQPKLYKPGQPVRNFLRYISL